MSNATSAPGPRLWSVISDRFPLLGLTMEGKRILGRSSHKSMSRYKDSQRDDLLFVAGELQ